MPHTYATATALAIALNITMLTPAVSAPRCDQWNRSTLTCTCRKLCEIELWNTAKLWDRTSFIHSKPLRDTCVAKCVATKTAAQH
jgi:hypothetical protein